MLKAWERCLRLALPIQVFVEIVIVEGFLDSENLAGAMGFGQPHCRETGTLINHPRNHLPEGEFALPGRAQCLDDADLLCHLIEGPNRPYPVSEESMRGDCGNFPVKWDDSEVGLARIGSGCVMGANPEQSTSDLRKERRILQNPSLLDAPSSEDE